jgi:hypothetical protein
LDGLAGCCFVAGFSFAGAFFDLFDASGGSPDAFAGDPGPRGSANMSGLTAPLADPLAMIVRVRWLLSPWAQLSTDIGK